MALADLVASLKAEAAEQRDAVLAEARERARQVRADEEAAARRYRSESLGAAEREAREEARRSVSGARMEAAIRVLDARARLLERVRRAVERRIEHAARDPVYLEVLPGELRAGLARLPHGPVEARVARALEPAVAAAATGIDSVTVVRAPDVGAGYTLHASDGVAEIDATLSARLELGWPRVVVGVLQEVDA
jgi:vacuolar-type H+-ATPase subunit E/Vma4